LFGDPLVRAQVAELAVGPILVVVAPEVFEHHASLAQVEQQFSLASAKESTSWQ
jgi:hypothetical protein